MDFDELLNTLQRRQIIYAFLKSVYEKELPKSLLAEMPQKMKPLLPVADLFPSAETKQLVRELVQFTEKIPSEDLDNLDVQLAADYARLFLSTKKVPAHPSESVYREGMMMQYSRDEVLKTYWSFKVDKKAEFRDTEDHIAVELSFMMYLCGKTVDALKNKNKKEAEKYLLGQEDFLEGHLAKWIPKFVQDILNTAKTPFYRGIAALTRDYIEMDLTVTNDLLKHVRG
jgi:anaerobic sulfite reductase subunit A